MATSKATNNSDFNAIIKRGDYEAAKEFLDRITETIDRVAVVNTASASGSTPLFTTCWDGRHDLTELLIQCGAKVNWKNLRGNRAIDMAIEQSHESVVQLLLANSAEATIETVVEIRTKTGKKISPKIDSMIDEANAGQKQAAAAAALAAQQTALQKKNQPIKPTQQLLLDLYQAVLTNRVSDLEVMFKDRKYKDMVNEVVVEEEVPAHGSTLAAAMPAGDPSTQSNQPLLFTAAARGYIDCIAILLKHGADLNFRDKNGRSALHMAIANNQYQSSKILLDEGANTTGVDMRQIRFWSMSNISNRLDNLLKKYPPKPLQMSTKNRSPLEGLTLKEFQLQKKIFSFFDINNDGFISEAELLNRLNETRRGPKFDSSLIHEMIQVANSHNNQHGVSFEQFVTILSPQRSENVNTSNTGSGTMPQHLAALKSSNLPKNNEPTRRSYS